MSVRYAIRSVNGGYFDGVSSQSKPFAQAQLYLWEESCREIIEIMKTSNVFSPFLIDKVYIL